MKDNRMDNIVECAYNMDNGYVEVWFTDGNMLRIKCEEVEAALRTTEQSLAKLHRLLDNKPIEYVAMALSGEMQAYCDIENDMVKGMFGTNVTAVQLGLSALKEAEKTDEIVLTGFDAGEAQIEALKNGEIEGLAVQNPFGIGYASVVAAARSILQTGNEALVDTGYVWVTNENMEDASIKNMLYK